jgi:hypothetical protein
MVAAGSRKRARCPYNGISGGVGGVLANLQDGVIIEDTVENVICLAGRAGNRARAVDAALIGGMGIKRKCLLVIAEVTGVEGAEQPVTLDSEALTVG